MLLPQIRRLASTELEKFRLCLCSSIKVNVFRCLPIRRHSIEGAVVGRGGRRGLTDSGAEAALSIHVTQTGAGVLFREAHVEILAFEENMPWKNTCRVNWTQSKWIKSKNWNG